MAVVGTEVTKHRGDSYVFAPRATKPSVLCCAFRDDYEHRNLSLEPEAAANVLPLLQFARLPTNQFVELAQFFWTHFGCYAAVADSDPRTCARMQRLLEESLRPLGGDVPKGLPNSQAEGMHRGNGLPWAPFAASMQNLGNVLAIAKMAGVFAGRYSMDVAKQSDFIVVPGPFLYTTSEHLAYKSNKNTHNDVKPGDPFNIRILAVLANAQSAQQSARVLRAGCVFSLYLRSSALWRSTVEAMLSKNMGRPPNVTLGSGKAALTQRRRKQVDFVLAGGAIATLEEARSWSDEKLQVEFQKLPTSLKKLAGRAPPERKRKVSDEISQTQWLTQGGYAAAQSIAELAQMKDRGLPVRAVALHALAGNILMSGSEGRSVVSSTTYNTAKSVVDHSLRHLAPEKLHSFVAEGGSKGHRGKNRQKSTFHAARGSTHRKTRP